MDFLTRRPEGSRMDSLGGPTGAPEASITSPAKLRVEP